jgi:hypothetical protein
MTTPSKAGRRQGPPRSDSGSESESNGPRRPAGPANLVGIFLRAARDFWGESFFLMAFNVITSISLIPGFLLLTYAVASRQVLLAGAGGAALLAWPFTTFGLFHAAAEVVNGEPVHFRTFFAGGRRRLGLAYRWGGLNLAVLALLAVNTFFYVDPEAPLYGTGLGSFLGAFFLLAHPGPVVVVGAVSLILFVAGFAILPLGLLLAFSLVAILACRTAAELSDVRHHRSSRKAKR